MAKLTDKRKAFVEHYLQCWNATKAAELAGYADPNNYGPRLIYIEPIRDEIQKRMSEMAMDADEVLLRLSQHARASIADFLEPLGEHQYFLNIEKVMEQGHLIKKIRYTRHGPEIELHDPQSALVQLGKAFALFTDKVKVEDWRDEVIALLREGKVTKEEIIDELGSSLAEELFESAGISVASGGKAEKEAPVED